MKPLRKITRRYVVNVKTRRDRMLRRFEELECGHIIREKTDMYGPTNAYRRRCRYCPDKAEGLINQVI